VIPTEPVSPSGRWVGFIIPQKTPAVHGMSITPHLGFSIDGLKVVFSEHGLAPEKPRYG